MSGDRIEELEEQLAESSISVLELRAALASARAEIETGKQERTMMRGHEMASVVANARLVMAEEAARAATNFAYDTSSTPRWATVGGAIRALAPLPASLVVLPVEAVAKVREALEKFVTCVDGDRNPIRWTPEVDALCAALAALEGK